MDYLLYARGYFLLVADLLNRIKNLLRLDKCFLETIGIIVSLALYLGD